MSIAAAKLYVTCSVNVKLTGSRLFHPIVIDELTVPTAYMTDGTPLVKSHIWCIVSSDPSALVYTNVYEESQFGQPGFSLEIIWNKSFSHESKSTVFIL